MNKQEIVEAMRQAYRFGEVAGVLQDPMELAYGVAREQLANGFTHKFCGSGCGFCTCQGDCEKYGIGSLPPAPKGE